LNPSGFTRVSILHSQITMNFNAFVLIAKTKVLWADAVEDPNYPMPPLIFKNEKLNKKYLLCSTIKRGVCNAPLGIKKLQ
jgi:hypothetical protein